MLLSVLSFVVVVIFDFRGRALELTLVLPRGRALELISRGGVRAEPGCTEIITNNGVGDREKKLRRAFYDTRLCRVAPEVLASSIRTAPFMLRARDARVRTLHVAHADAINSVWYVLMVPT